MPKNEPITVPNPCSSNPCNSSAKCFAISGKENEYICGQCPPYTIENGKFCSPVNDTLPEKQWERKEVEQKVHRNRCLDETLNPCFDKV